MVVFSTGNVYPLVPVDGPAAAEDLLPAPVGEYAQSCLGRERVSSSSRARPGMRAVDLPPELRRRSSLRHARRHRQAGLQRRADRFDGRVLQRHLAGRREQLCAAQPGAVLDPAGRPECDRARTDLRARSGGMVRRSVRAPARLRQQRRAGRAPERLAPVPRASLGEPLVLVRAAAGMGRALGRASAAVR